MRTRRVEACADGSGALSAAGKMEAIAMRSLRLPRAAAMAEGTLGCVCHGGEGGSNLMVRLSHTPGHGQREEGQWVLGAV